MCTLSSSSNTCSRCATLSVPRRRRMTSISRLMAARWSALFLADTAPACSGSTLGSVLQAKVAPVARCSTSRTMPFPPLPRVSLNSYTSSRLRAYPRSTPSELPEECCCCCSQGERTLKEEALSSFVLAGASACVVAVVPSAPRRARVRADLGCPPFALASARRLPAKRAPRTARSGSRPGELSRWVLGERNRAAVGAVDIIERRAERSRTSKQLAGGWQVGSSWICLRRQATRRHCTSRAVGW
mmetsp:Transcript_15377/g.39620  ORF Transcript_15377/g.39620 Transcript_15377/m.39620 type:complete len:244 (+) Transcript_15377:1382-2113(+)